MKLVFRPTTPLDERELIEFLAKAFFVPLESPFLRSELIRWKYWDLREDYSEPRSYVVESDGQMVAHAGIWPVLFRMGTQMIRGAHMIDWASDRSAAGVGTIVAKRIMQLFDFVYTVGGSADARRVLPALGFRSIKPVWSAARPLRPGRQMLRHQQRGWKTPARFIRNMVWSLLPRRVESQGWSLGPANLVDTSDEPAALGPDGCLGRSPAFFRYLQRCPSARVEVLQLNKDGQDEGRVAISYLSNQARIAGIWLHRSSAEALLAAYRLAEGASRSADMALEVTANGSTEKRAKAAATAGLRIRGYRPAYVFSRQLAVGESTFDFQAADNDGAFFSDARPEFLT